MTVDPRTGLNEHEKVAIKKRLGVLARRLAAIEVERGQLNYEANELREEQTKLNARVHQS